MLSISYDDVYSRFLSLVEAHDLLALVVKYADGDTDDSKAKAMMNEWLKSVKANPRVRKIFATLTFDPAIETIDFELKNPVDDEYDTSFVVEVLALGVAWKWVTPKYQSVVNTAQFFGGKEQSYFSQANHMAELKKMYDSAESNLYNLISSHGYYNNSYIGGV